MKRLPLGTFLAWALLAASTWAEAWREIPRPLPPPGIAISAADRRQLEQSLAELEEKIARWQRAATAESIDELAADVQTYAKAVRFALDNTEFYREQDVAAATQLISTGSQRVDQLLAGNHPWSESTGLLVRGYRSRVDDSVQPYGLVLPEGLDRARKVPLFVWLHGRNDKLADLQFIEMRERQAGQLQPPDAIVLHPFGRSCLGWKSTAEIDVLEAIEAVERQYKIDPDRIVLMGFSMGGAGAWHLGAHYTEHWAGVHAGAGFVDVARYQRLAPEAYPPWYEQKLWGTYDVPAYVRSLFNLPVVAYSGEIDKQKHAADIMAEAFTEHGHSLVHLIGPGMGHKYDDTSWREVVERMTAAAARGRDSAPRAISWQSRTLRYPRLHWVEAQGLAEHWRDSRINARFTEDDSLAVTTENVTALELSPPGRVGALSIDGQEVELVEPPRRYVRREGRWQHAPTIADAPLAKKPGLQGPIDDVLLEPFLVVLPSGQSSDANVDRWIKFELDHFQKRWQAVYRGTLRAKRDTEVTPDDIAQFHLIAWGDPNSNALIARAADRLPIRWTLGRLEVGERAFDASAHVPLLIYPNPLNPARYLVLNSGPTHREAHDRTNSLQNPKLPDWAVLDVTASPDAERPGRVVAADFFDEAWQIRPSQPAN